jgi:hypothetical protein
MVQFFEAGANMKEETKGHVAKGLTQIANNLEKLVCDIRYLDKQLPPQALGGVDIQDSHRVDFVIQAAGWNGGQHGWIDRN